MLECANRCFPGAVRLRASDDVRAVLSSKSPAYGKGAHDSEMGPADYTIAVGSVDVPGNAIQVTFDGWNAGIAPARSFDCQSETTVRLPEFWLAPWRYQKSSWTSRRLN